MTILYNAKNFTYDSSLEPVNHLAVIMDGNGRWAERRGLPRWKGHEMGVEAVRRLIEAAGRLKIPMVTVFAFSSENWKRPEKEVRILFSLFYRYFRSELQSLKRNRIRLSVFGRRDRVPGFVREAIGVLERETQNNHRLHLRVALDYGSRYEIVEAVRALARDALEKKIDPARIDEELFSRYLCAPDTPDPDLIIRTAGEQRLSNFLLWQAAYSEFYFCPKFWPDFEASDLEEALLDYNRRTRRFGALPRAAESRV
jgi:undecaprenyl diphosphate synthase